MRRLTRAMCQAVTVVRPGDVVGEDDYGNVSRAPEQRFHLTGVSLQPAKSQEQMTPSSNVITTGWLLFADTGVDIRSSDRVQQAADRISPVESDDDAALDLQVDGRPAEWAMTGTSLDHVEVALKLWEG